MTSRAEQYRQLARDFHFMARDLPPGENRSTLLKMAEECERLADQQEQATDLRQERSKRARRRELCLTEKPIPERLHEDRQKQAQDHISSEPEGEPKNLATAKEPWALVGNGKYHSSGESTLSIATRSF